MARTLLRLLALGALVTTGCHKSAPEVPATLRFLPAAADIGVRIDLTRARAWSGYAKVSATVFKGVQPAIAAVKGACGFDLLGEAGSIIVARNGLGPGADLGLVIAGLPLDKLRGCPAKLASSIPGLEIVADGDLFVVNRGGKGFASGAILASGELVLVERKAASVEPAAWKTEVASGTGGAPAWWAELDPVQPLAVRVVRDGRTVTASAELGDPLVIRGKLVSSSVDEAKIDMGRLKAIVDFLTKAEAGTGRLEPRDDTIHGDFTATGPQIDHLMTAALSAIGADDAAEAPAPSANATAPIECSELAGAVAQYLTTSQASMPPDQKEMMAKVVVKLLPALQKAYVDSCTTDHWPLVAIHCHVDHAAEIPKFEKCRLAIPDEMRGSFDKTVAAALATAR